MGKKGGHAGGHGTNKLARSEAGAYERHASGSVFLFKASIDGALVIADINSSLSH